MWGKFKNKGSPLAKYRNKLRSALSNAYENPPNQETLEELATQIEHIIDLMSIEIGDGDPE